MWGSNSYGQLGDNTTTHKSSPVQTVSSGLDWLHIATSGDHTLSIKSDYTLWSWGNNYFGQLGLNSTAKFSSPVQVGIFTSWLSIATFGNNSAAINASGQLWVWGSNSYGLLGDNTSTHKSSPVQTVAGGSTWEQVAVGKNHMAAIKSDSTLWLWGSNRYGKLGDSTTVHRSSPVQTISGGTDWSQVACGDDHTAAIKTNGSLWLWGNNSFGQMGNSSTVDTSSPIQTIVAGTDWEQVCAGNNFTTAIKTDYTLWSWGKNDLGQLSINTTLNISSPVQTVGFATNWSAVRCGHNNASGIKSDGTLWTWGSNSIGQLGNGISSSIVPTYATSSPVQTVAGGNEWYDFSVGKNAIAAISSSTFNPKNLWVWGGNNRGQLGDGTTIDRSIPVQTIDNITDWQEIIVGSAFMAGLTKSGRIWCWGENTYGQLGDNSSGQAASKSSPVQTITFATNWTKISAGSSFLGAIKDDGSLWMWGNNNYGQLGDGSRLDKSSPVQTTAFGTDWASVSCPKTVDTTGYAAGIKTDNTIWLWGNNYFGQLGDNTTVHKSSPVQTVTFATNWSKVALGHGHVAAIKSDGSLWTWGFNYYGQLGDNSVVTKSSPVQTAAGGSTWSQVACGFLHTVAIKSDGTLWSWGHGIYGQLGQGEFLSISSPVQTLFAGTDWSKVDCGYFHTIARKTNGTIWTWGKNSG